MRMLALYSQAVEAKLRETVACTDNGHARGTVSIRLTLLRSGTEHTVDATVALLGSEGAKRILCWHGLVLQETPRSVCEVGPVPAGVYISQTMLGSPGEADCIEGEFLLAVNSIPTPTLDAVIALDNQMTSTPPTVGGGKQRHHLRIESADTSGRRFMKTLEPDLLFWPVCQISQDNEGGWSCIECGI